MTEPLYNLDLPLHPDNTPSVHLADIVRFAPLIEELIVAVEAALAGKEEDIPAVKFRIKGELVTLGPTPIKVG